jgi:hypothetical protein
MKKSKAIEEDDKERSIQSALVLHDRKSGMSLSQQAQLASDALMVSQLLELLNDIQNEIVISREIDLGMIENGIEIIQNIKRGEDYLNQRKTNLMQRPNSANTVKYIKEHTGLEICESSERVISTLNAVKNHLFSKEVLDIEGLEFTKNFLRTIHSGIMDQLETSMPSNIYLEKNSALFNTFDL